MSKMNKTIEFENNTNNLNTIPETQKNESQAQQQQQPQKKDSEEKTGEKLINNQKKERLLCLPSFPGPDFL